MATHSMRVSHPPHDITCYGVTHIWMICANDNIRYYCLSILDKHHHPDISLEQGMKLLELCTDELKRRLPIDFKGVSGSSCGPMGGNLFMRSR